MHAISTLGLGHGDGRAKVLQRLHELLRLVLGHVLLEGLRHRLDKLLRLGVSVPITGTGTGVVTAAETEIILRHHRLVAQLTSTRFMLGMIALTSRMILALAAASIFSSFSVKMVFSFGFSSAAGASPASAAAAATGAAEAAGSATSVMLRRVWG